MPDRVPTLVAVPKLLMMVGWLELAVMIWVPGLSINCCAVGLFCTGILKVPFAVQMVAYVATLPLALIVLIEPDDTAIGEPITLLAGRF